MPIPFTIITSENPQWRQVLLTGAGANVTLASTATTATLGNGVVSILCTKSGATINQINYTLNNNGGSQTLNLLSGGNNGGHYNMGSDGAFVAGETWSKVCGPYFIYCNNGVVLGGRAVAPRSSTGWW